MVFQGQMVRVVVPCFLVLGWRGSMGRDNSINLSRVEYKCFDFKNCLLPMGFYRKVFLAAFCLSQFFDAAFAQKIRLRDGQYHGKSNAGERVYAIVRSGKVISALFDQRVSGCDNSNANWDCSGVNAQIRAVDSCTIIWTIPWEEGFSYRAKLTNLSC